MAKKTFILKGKATKEAMNKNKSSGGFKRFKMQGKVANVLILGPTKEGEAVFGVNIVQEMFTKAGKLVYSYGSQKAFGGEDVVEKMGWKIRNKYKDDTNKAKKEFFKRLLPKKKYNLNIIDMDNKDEGVQRWENVPNSVMDTIFSEIEDCEDDLTTICDLTEGRILKIKTNGKSGLDKRYQAKFTVAANLDLSDEELEALFEQVKPLSSCQRPYNEEGEAKAKEYWKQAMAKVGIKLSSEDEEEEMENEDEDDADEFESDDDGDDDGGDDDDDEPAPAKSKKPAPKVNKKDADFDEDEDFDDDIVETDDDDGEEFEEDADEDDGDDEPPPKQVVKKKK